jgi:branched-chain amino acid transport system substrate-binding protein
MKHALICLILILLSVPVMGSLQNGQSEDFQKILVGAVLPFDGQWASLGKDSEVGLNLAVDILNDYLEPYNLAVELLIENSSSDPGKALEALKKLHEKGVMVVIGPSTSEEAAAMVTYANENDILLLAPSSTAVSLARDDNLFRMVANDNNQAEALALLMKRQNITRVLTVYMDDEYGSGLNSALNKKASDPTYGFQIIGSIPYDPKSSNYDALVKKIEDAASDLPKDTGAILLIGTESHATGIFSSAGVESPISGYKWFSGDSVIHEAGILENKDAAEFAVKTRLEGVAFACEETITLVPLMLATGLMSGELGHAPSPDALPVWDALWFIAEAYRLDPDADIDTFKSNIRVLFERGGNLFNQIATLDENGDLPSAKYARFTATKSNTGKIFWNLDGMFIRSKTSGMFITDADGNLTHESGDIIIGAVLPITGENEEMGKGAEKAIELAIEQANTYYVNALGLAIRFSTDIRDSESDPNTALEQVKALHEKGINIIIFGGISAELLAVQEYARENNIIILSTRSTAISLSDSDDFIYRLNPDDSHLVKAMVRLMEEQGKKHLVVLHRDDIYGQDFSKALSETFTGSIDRLSYSANQTDFTSILDEAAAAVEKAGYQDTAVVAIGTEEIITLLEAVKDGPLTSVAWYSGDGVSQSRDLLASDKAVSVAVRTNLTCANFDNAADQLYVPMRIVGVEYLSRAIGGKAGWNEISNYDAAWIAMNAYAMTRPDAHSEELWNIINNPYGAVGIGPQYVTNDAQDQSNSCYAFYMVTETNEGPEWTPVAYYRDFKAFPDDLKIISTVD